MNKRQAQPIQCRTGKKQKTHRGQCSPDKQKPSEAQDKHPIAAAQTARPTHHELLRNKGGAPLTLYTHTHSHTDTDTRRLSAPAEPAAPPGAYAPTRTTRAWNSWLLRPRRPTPYRSTDLLRPRASSARRALQRMSSQRLLRFHRPQSGRRCAWFRA